MLTPRGVMMLFITYSNRGRTPLARNGTEEEEKWDSERTSAPLYIAAG